ncbi:ABC transporter permease [Marinimicrococcus flavescens]|uniref:ABC transporter permease n=1 Tax=Marinimicrococcus flavescens TaxID=3031815 RepID=A0AAP3XQR3_9PROT|nr:ABC transporter permease [Marinimicrococcus flavescens]
MGSFIARRSLQSLVALAGLIVLVFFAARLTGSPADLYLPIDASVEARQAFNEKHGFNDPLTEQFGRFLVDLARFDLGHSIRKDRPALEVVLEAIPTTLALAAVTMTLAVAGAILVGSLAARRPGGAVDRLGSTLSLAAASAPDFWVAISAILLFAVALGWLPTSGMGTFWHWIMPVGVLLIRPFGILVQVVRGSMLGALSAPYVKTARAKGIRERTVVFVHALRNGLLPVITVAGDQAAGIVNGAVIVETIFGWPGIGKLMIDSIIQRDFAVIQASILVTAAIIFAMNIVIDLAYGLLDPRVRHA